MMFVLKYNCILSTNQMTRFRMMVCASCKRSVNFAFQLAIGTLEQGVKYV